MLDLNCIEKLLLAHESEQFAYNCGLAIEVSPSLDHERLARACQELLEQVPILKTKIIFDGPRRVALDRSDLPLIDAGKDFSRLDTEVFRPFALEQEYPIRFFHASDERRSLVAVIVHHSVVDGLAQSQLVQLLMQLYHGNRTTSLPLRPPIKPGRKGWLSIVCNRDFLKVAKTYFLKKSAASLSSWPVHSKQEYGFREFVLEGPALSAFREKAQVEQTSTFGAVLVALAASFHRLEKSDRPLTVLFPANLREVKGVSSYAGNLAVLSKLILSRSCLEEGGAFASVRRQLKDALDPAMLSLSYDFFEQIVNVTSFEKLRRNLQKIASAPKKLSSSFILSYMRLDPDFLPKEMTLLRLSAFFPTFKSPGLGIVAFSFREKIHFSVSYGKQEFSEAQIDLFTQNIHRFQS